MKLNKIWFLVGAICIVVGGSLWSMSQQPASFSEKKDRKTDMLKIYDTSSSTLMEVPRVEKTEQEWKSELSPEAFHIARKKGTERAFTGKYHDHKGQGVYHCIACGTALYDSKTKYDSGTGWPSFWEPIHANNIATAEDNSFFMRRTEVLCARCGSHLGHVFDDGPEPTFKRHCINSAALDFQPVEP